MTTCHLFNNLQIDKSLATFFFANNIPFRVVEDTFFTDFVKLLRPGYKPPTRQKLSEELLESIHDDMTEKMKETIQGNSVTLSVDAWSDVNNTPILASSVVYKKDVIVIDATETTGVPHTAENLIDFVENQVQVAQEKFNVKVVGLVILQNLRKTEVWNGFVNTILTVIPLYLRLLG